MLDECTVVCEASTVSTALQSDTVSGVHATFFMDNGEGNTFECNKHYESSNVDTDRCYFCVVVIEVLLMERSRCH